MSKNQKLGQGKNALNGIRCPGDRRQPINVLPLLVKIRTKIW